MSVKVIAFTRYAINGASSRLRIYQYIDLLKSYNIDIEPSPLFNENYINLLYSGRGRSVFNVIACYIRRVIKLISVAKYDLVIIEKELFPYLPSVFESLLYFFKKKYIVDYDDAVFHCYDQSNNFYIKLLSKKIDVIMRRSDLVICGNEYIAKRAQAANSKNIEIIPTVVDIDKYHVSEKKISPGIVIGWIGTPSTVHFLEVVRESLEALSSEFDIVLHVIGAEFNSDVFKVKCVDWTENTEEKSIQAIDIGIMPLNDGLFERGKCGYKLIQYMACGKPIIASPVGVNEKIVKESNAGYLAITVVDWTRVLGVLCGSDSLREKHGYAARKYIEKEYSMQIKLPILADLIIKLNQN